MNHVRLAPATRRQWVTNAHERPRAMCRSAGAKEMRCNCFEPACLGQIDISWPAAIGFLGRRQVRRIAMVIYSDRRRLRGSHCILPRRLVAFTSHTWRRCDTRKLVAKLTMLAAAARSSRSMGGLDGVCEPERVNPRGDCARSGDRAALLPLARLSEASPLPRSRAAQLGRLSRPRGHASNCRR